MSDRLMEIVTATELYKLELRRAQRAHRAARAMAWCFTLAGLAMVVLMWVK